MPNWAENRLTVTGDPRRVAEFDKAFKGRPAAWPLQEFVKWGKTPEEVAEIEVANQEEIETERHCFNALYPVPEEVLEVGYSVPTAIGESAKVLHDFDFVGKSPAETPAALRDPKKWRDGYTWCVSHWGTKWDVEEMHDATLEGGLAEYTFDTAWSPPIEWLEKVARDWAELEFVLVYCELGCAFAGRYTIKGDAIDSYETRENNFRGFVEEVFGFDPYMLP